MKELGLTSLDVSLGGVGDVKPTLEKMKELGFWWQLKERTTLRGYVDNYRETSKSCLLFFFKSVPTGAVGIFWAWHRDV